MVNQKDLERRQVEISEAKEDALSLEVERRDQSQPKNPTSFSGAAADLEAILEKGANT